MICISLFLKHKSGVPLLIATATIFTAVPALETHASKQRLDKALIRSIHREMHASDCVFLVEAPDEMPCCGMGRVLVADSLHLSVILMYL